MSTTNTSITSITIENETELLNQLIDESVTSVIQEAVQHFNKERKRVRNPEDDCRYLWNDEELSLFLKQIKFPEKVWVSSVYDDTGKFYAYRIGRVIINKKQKEVRY